MVFVTVITTILLLAKWAFFFQNFENHSDKFTCQYNMLHYHKGSREPFPHISRDYSDGIILPQQIVNHQSCRNQGENMSILQRQQWDLGDLPRGTDLRSQVRLVIHGAGVREVNGLYLPSGMRCNRLSWMNRRSRVQLWYDIEWKIGKNENVYYLGSNDSDNYLTLWRLGDLEGKAKALRLPLTMWSSF
jgi:hypothetical protein